jgi:hypothetical protein
MGFVKQNINTVLSAFLTQKGREYMIKGSLEDFEVKYFSLSDPDVNYMIETNLESGFVPDLSGSGQNLAGGVGQRYSLYGGDNVGPLGTNLEIGGVESTVSLTETTITIDLDNKKLREGFDIEVPLAVITGFCAKERIKAYFMPVSKGSSESLYFFSKLQNDGVVSWVGNGIPTTTVKVSFSPKALATVKATSQLVIGITPYKSPLAVASKTTTIILNPVK